MFETAEIGHVVDKETYRQQVPLVRRALLEQQLRLLARPDVALLVVVGGVDGAGKGETINQLQAWLDPRHVRVHAFGAPSDEERARPEFWRYWRVLPPKGKIGVFMGSWYSAPITDRVGRRIQDTHLDTAMERARHFEKMLTDEGVVLLKLWFHLSKREQRARLRRLERDPATRWRVGDQEWENFAKYERFRRVSARALRQTSTDNAPWLVVSGADFRYRELAVARALTDAVQRGLERPKNGNSIPPVPHTPPTIDGKTILDTLDLGRKFEGRGYRERLEREQGRLNRLTRTRGFARRSLVVVFEGQDAAGKGGAIRRVTAALDARMYGVVPIAAPTDEERAQPYLWRFWRHVPAHARAVIFDRSWYGRVLVERVEGFAPTSDWVRGYSEINDFEQQLVDHGAVVVKLWLQIDPEEQLRRFRERESTEFKRYKITAEDWRNRDKWDAYRIAVADMIARTSSDVAPWTLVEANDKRFARIKVLESIADALEAAK